jgi:AcrR family transcriptional regulator
LRRAAREAIEDGGYGAGSVVAIAERAGVASGTLYRHFTSKEELFVELFRSVRSGEERATRAATVAVPPEASAVDRLEAALSTFAERALRNPRLAWALIAEPVDRLVDAERSICHERYASLVAEVLRVAIGGGEVPMQNVEFTAAAVVGGCGQALFGPLSPFAGTRPEAEDVVAALRALVRRSGCAASERPSGSSATVRCSPSCWRGARCSACCAAAGGCR